jgi:hypothetical protein
MFMYKQYVYHIQNVVKKDNLCHMNISSFCWKIPKNLISDATLENFVYALVHHLVSFSKGSTFFFLPLLQDTKSGLEAYIQKFVVSINIFVRKRHILSGVA